MKEPVSIVDHLKRRKKPTVPAGFFDDFYDSLMGEIDSRSCVLGQLTKRSTPALPPDYFKKPINRLLAIEDTPLLVEIQRAERPSIPDSFFETFPDRLNDLINTSHPSIKKASRIIPLWIVGTVTSVAATIAIFFLIQGMNTTVDETPVMTEVVTEETYDAYLSYLDEDEIIEYIIESEIEIESPNESLNDHSLDDYSVEDIEDYYLETL